MTLLSTTKSCIGNAKIQCCNFWFGFRQHSSVRNWIFVKCNETLKLISEQPCNFPLRFQSNLQLPTLIFIIFPVIASIFFTFNHFGSETIDWSGCAAAAWHWALLNFYHVRCYICWNSIILESDNSTNHFYVPLHPQHQFFGQTRVKHDMSAFFTLALILANWGHVGSWYCLRSTPDVKSFPLLEAKWWWSALFTPNMVFHCHQIC